MNEFDGGGELDMSIAAIAKLVSARERDQGPQPLASGIDEVRRQLRDQRGLARHARMNGGIHRGKIASDKRRQPLHRIDRKRRRNRVQG